MTATEKLPYTQKRNKQKQIKTRYHNIPVEAMPDDIRTAYQSLRDHEAKANADRDFIEAHAGEFARRLTVNVEGYGESLPMVPDGFEPVYGFNFGQFAIGAVSASEKQEKGAKVSVNFAPLLGPDKKPKK